MITLRRVAIGFVLVVVSSLVLYVAVFIIAAATAEITESAGEDFAGPIPTEAIGPLSELEFVDGESSDSADPLTP